MIEVLENNWIKETYDRVDNFERNNNAIAHHGIEHVMNVTKIAEKLLKELNYNTEIIESAKIACILHDIGCVEGKKNHAFRSYKMAKNYFQDKNIKLQNETEILEAIKNHSNGFESNNIITLTVLIADKLDIDKRRITTAGCLVIGMRQLQYIDKININVEEGILKINFIVDDKFNREELEKFYFMEKVLKSVRGFCKKNKIDYIFMINNQKWDIK